jgi:hypothetical protein
MVHDRPTDDVNYFHDSAMVAFDLQPSPLRGDSPTHVAERIEACPVKAII